MLWEFKNNKNIAKKICSVCTQGVITDHQVRNWFSKFHSGDTALRDKLKPGCSLDLDQEALRDLVECNPLKSTQELVLNLNTFQSTICHHLKKTGKVSKLSAWFPHTLSEKNKEDCISIVTSLLLRQRNDLFLKNIITGDEKCVFFMTMFNIKGSLLTRTNLHSLRQREASWKLCRVYGGITMIQFILSFKLQSDTQCKLIFSTAAMCAWKSSKKMPNALQKGKRCGSQK